MSYAYETFARSDRAAPTRTIVLLDASGSMNSCDYRPTRIAAAGRATARLIDLKAREYPADEVGLVSFSITACELMAPLSAGTHAKPLIAACQNLDTGWQTNITAGLEQAARTAGLPYRPVHPLSSVTDAFLGEPPLRLPATGCELDRRVQFILLTDGAHNHDVKPLATARRLKDAGVDVAAIGIGGSPSAVDEPTLKEIASLDESGEPQYCFIDDANALIREFERLGGHLRRMEN